MKRLHRPSMVLACVFLLGVVACAPNASAPTLTAVPTDPPAPTLAPTATALPVPPTATYAPTATLLPAPPPGDSLRTVSVNGTTRTYSLHIPPGLDALHPAPLLFAFHGYTGNEIEFPTTTGLNTTSDKAHFVIVYPKGTGTSDNDLSWNAGNICCGAAIQNKIDETAFVRAILADMKTIVNVDSKRIYATGMSNGAMLTYRLACEMSDTFAAIAPVAGVLEYAPCQPAQPVSVVHIHGLADDTVAFEGGTFGFQPIPQSISTWAQLDGCGGSPQVTQDKTVTHTVYASCRAGTDVELYAIQFVGHEWPSSSKFETDKTIWDFFAAHPKP